MKEPDVQNVSLDRIVDSPFQVRREYNDIDSLAAEIKAHGFHGRRLRARRVGNELQLISGHRCIRALRKLKWERVPVEIIDAADMPDSTMALQGMIENLQREGLTDLEKGEGVKMLLAEFAKDPENHPKPQVEIATMLGLGQSWISDLAEMANMDDGDKEPVRKKKIAGKVMIVARRIGGKEFGKRIAACIAALEKGDPRKSLHAVTRLKQSVDAITDETVKLAILEELASGKLSPDDEVVDKRAEKLREKIITTKGKKIAPSALEHMAVGTKAIKRVLPELKKAVRAYENNPKTGKIPEAFAAAVASLRLVIDPSLIP